MIAIKKHIAVLLLVLCGFANAQQHDSVSVKELKPGQLKKFGKNAMIQNDYGAGILYLDRYMRINAGDYKRAFMLAECYRNFRDYKKAQEWYLKSFEKSGRTEALALYYYALMLKMNGDYINAKNNFAQFKKISSGKKALQPYVRQMKQDLLGCDSVDVFNSKRKKIAVIHVDTSVNKIYVESSPLPLNDSTILFSSLRANKRVYITSEDTTNIPVRKFYTATRKGDNWTYQGEFDGPFNEQGYNTGNGAFSVDGKRFYFTRCKKSWQDKMICAIYVSELQDGKWQEPTMLSETINNPKYSNTQPAVAIEGQKKNEVIYFASNRPGGRGGYDIWYVIYDLKRKVYRSPRNLGGKINTPQDDMTPYYDSDKRILYFSTSGWPGLGGMDVFRVRGDIGKWNNTIENVGAPINSSADDLYFAEGKRKDEGFFVSNRKGSVALKNPTCCDDLYAFKRLEYIHLNVKGKVHEGKEKQNGPCLAGSTVSLYIVDPKDPEPIFIKSIETDCDFDFELEPQTDYKVVLSKDGYFKSQTTFSTKPYTNSQTITTHLGADPLPKDAIVLKNIYYDTDKADLKTDSKTVIDTTLLVVLNENPDLIIEISSHTDYRGTDSYNQNLSQRRAESVVKYLIAKGIKKERLIAKGYGESKPIAPNKTPDGKDDAEGMAKNRRTEFRIVGKIENTEVDYEE